MSSLAKQPTKQLLVAGYIRAIEVLLANTIPDEIFLLCYGFYRCIMKIGIAYSHKFLSELTGYGVMDIQSLSITNYTFIEEHESTGISISSNFLYSIDDIFNRLPKNLMLNFNNKKYQVTNGIFGKSSGPDAIYDIIYPCILFHGKYQNKNKILHEFRSKKEMPNFKTLLVCDDRNAIYAEHDAALYELKFSDVIDDNFGFTKIHDVYLWNEIGEYFLGETHLQLEYIQNMDQLFAIKCATSYFDDGGDYAAREKQCCIYDFTNKEWKEASSFKYQWKEDDFLCITAYDERYNVIYLQSSTGHTAKYDCDEDKWTMIVVDEVYGIIYEQRNMGKLWIDGNKLKWALRDAEIRELDLNSSGEETKWVKVSDAIESKMSLRVF